MRAIRNAARAIIVHDGKILTIECSDSQGPFYLLPGGGQEHGETLIEALRRECREEISADVDVRELRFVRDCLSTTQELAIFQPDIHQVEFLFLCDLCDGAEAQPGAAPDGPQTGIAWLPLDRLWELRLFPLALRSILSTCFDSDGRETGSGARAHVYIGDTH